MRKWWGRLLLAVIFWAISYGFISLAIDSGSLIEYAATLIFLAYGVKFAIRAIYPDQKRSDLGKR